MSDHQGPGERAAKERKEAAVLDAIDHFQLAAQAVYATWASDKFSSCDHRPAVDRDPAAAILRAMSAPIIVCRECSPALLAGAPMTCIRCPQPATEVPYIDYDLLRLFVPLCRGCVEAVVLCEK